MKKNLTESEINVILENYQEYFRRRLKRKLPKKYDMPFKSTEDDFLQEVMIYMWKLLKNKYDSSKGTINTFVTGHIDMTVKYVILNITKSLFYTGKNIKGPNKRTQMRKLQENTTSLDRLSTSSIKYSTTESMDSYLYSFGVLSNNDEDDISWNIDAKIILAEIKKQLPSDLYQIFDLICLQGKSQIETSSVINQRQGTISKNFRKIQEKVRTILSELGYED